MTHVISWCSCCPCCNECAAVPFACVCCAYTYTHTRCPTYSFAACFLSYIFAPSISSQSIILFDLLFIFSLLFCACIFPQMHTTLHVQGAVHARPYHAYPCVLLITAHKHMPTFILHLVGFSHTHLFLYTSAFLYIITFVFHSCARCDMCIWSVSVYTCTHTHTHLDLSPSARSVVLLLLFLFYRYTFCWLLCV